MKCTFTKFLSLTTAILLIMVTACQKRQTAPDLNPVSDQNQPTAVIDVLQEGDMKKAWFPVGTVFKDMPGGVHASPPEGWSYIGTTTNGKSVFLKEKVSTSITCTCNMGVGTCKPFESTGPWGTTRGCTGTCSNCTMSQNVIQRDPYQIVGGGYFQLEASTRLIKNGESIPAVFEELINLPEFGQRLKSFYDKAYSGSKIQMPVYGPDGTISAPDGFSLVGVSIMGRGLAIIVPEGFAKRELGYAANVKASCKCSNKTGDCTLKDKTILGMGSVWCDGTCNGCTLTTNTRLQSTEEIYQVNIFSVSF